MSVLEPPTQTLLAGKDQVTCVAYDFSGKRMATACADHTVRVYDRTEDSWALNDAWRAHDSVVSSVAWAGPYTSPIIATGSYDCTVRVWEEAFDETFESQKRWKKRHTFTEFQGPVYACAFDPQRAELRLAAVAADGALRVFACADPGNLGAWQQASNVPLLARPVARQLQSAFSLSWAPTPAFQGWLVVGALDDAFVLKPGKEAEGKTSYEIACELPGHQGLVRDVAWAPTFGLAPAIIATACKDGRVRIFSVRAGRSAPPLAERTFGGVLQEDHEFEIMEQNVAIEGASSDAPEPELEVETLLEADDHNSEVWRVAWNASGSILASTGNKADIKFWKSLFRGSYKCIAEID